MKSTYSNKSKSIGLVDFDQYKEGSLFKMQHYNDDYRIVKDEHGNVIKSPNLHNATKVDLVYDGKVIGMLSDNINQFQGDVSLAVFRNIVIVISFHLNIFKKLMFMN